MSNQLYVHKLPTVCPFFFPEYILLELFIDTLLVPPKDMIMDMLMTINTLQGLLSMTKYGLEIINGGFGIHLLYYAYTTYVTSENDKNHKGYDIYIILTS